MYVNTVTLPSPNLISNSNLGYRSSVWLPRTAVNVARPVNQSFSVHSPVECPVVYRSHLYTILSPDCVVDWIVKVRL